MRQDERDDLLIRLDENVRLLVHADDDKEKRIRKLEKGRWLHSGLVAIGAAVLAKIGVPIPGGH
jgi:hypothetical protein